jgi:hypothetical protein
MFLVLVFSGAFVWMSSGDLPPVVATHFGPGGYANGLMDRGSYRVFILITVVAIPSLVGFSGYLVRMLPNGLINIPNKQYWLAPQRRAKTLETIAYMNVYLGILLAAFLCFVHCLVVQANSVQPARLPEIQLFTGLVVFSVAIASWLFTAFRRFGQYA